MEEYVKRLEAKGYTVKGRIATLKTAFGEWVSKIQTDGKSFWIETVTYPAGLN